MLRLVSAFIACLLFAAPAFAHGGQHGGAAHPERAAHQHRIAAEIPAPAKPARHRHDPAVSFHCTLSIACAPLFTVADVGAVPAPMLRRSTWGVPDDRERVQRTPEREPPVPRA